MSVTNLLASDPAFQQNLKIKVLFHQGTVYLRTQEYDKAIDRFNQILSLQPHHGPALHKRGTAKFYSGKIKEACEDWKIACTEGKQCTAWNFGIYQGHC